MKLLNRPCVKCGKPQTSSYCAACREPERDRRTPYRVAYRSREYRIARAERFELAKGRCEALVDRRRCSRGASEAHHVIPLSSVRTIEAAVALCTVDNLRAVCFWHNPRGA